MGTKLFEMTNPNGCLYKAEGNEPIFVLRANDEIAPEVIRKWAQLYGDSKSLDSPTGTLTQKQADKLREALHLARQMEEWRHMRAALSPLPPHYSVNAGLCWCGRDHVQELSQIGTPPPGTPFPPAPLHTRYGRCWCGIEHSRPPSNGL